MKDINKNDKVINIYISKIQLLLNQIDFLFINKYITQTFYNEKMNSLLIIYNKLSDFKNNKKITKIILDDFLNNINKNFENICIKLTSINIIETLNLYINYNDYIKDKDNNFIELIKLYNEYFIPLSSNIVIDTKLFLKKYNIENKNMNIINLIEFSRISTLFEKINGVTFVFYINENKIIYINGYFKKDSLNIFKDYIDFKDKNIEIKDGLENIDIPDYFKEKYLEQITIKDFIIFDSSKIIEILKNNYEDLLIYKNKSLSLLIKEFVKSNIEKQRKILILLLISDKESQFSAHIIYDLINNKNFTTEFCYLTDTIYHSLDWKIQEILNITKENFEKDKKELENITINNVPYESRILSLKIKDNIKSKAMEKLKEINGSKENSVKAQQWLEGFLKIPFNIIKKEPLIYFFNNYQNKINNFIDIFTFKISEFNINNLNTVNTKIFNIIIQIIDEYHSNIYKSENSYNNFIKYIREIKLNIYDHLNIYDYNDNNIVTLKISNESNEYDENNILDSLYFKKIKKELYDSEIINENSIEIIINKLNELENKLDMKLLMNNDIPDIIDYDNYNIDFEKYILKVLGEFNEFINDWDNFKIDKKKYIKNVDIILDKCTYGQTDAKNQMKRIIGQWMNGNTKGQCFGLCGPPGVGKTTLCKNGLAKCLFDENGEERPFAFLPLGGATNGSILEGHHYTYLGSTWGKIVDILIETKCMNPIIYIDELDKISKTEHGREIISILTHITDQSQNKEFYDRYFTSIPIDLSNVLFIFSYNDRDNIDKILLDRIQEINIKPLSIREKIIISQNYIIPDILNNVGFTTSEIIFTNDILTKIINEYTFEAGVRKLNEILYDIIRDINLKKIMGNNVEYPIIINDSHINDILSNISKINIKKIHNQPKIGLVNGLYATNAGLGGLTVIQVMKTMSDKKLSLEKLTGNQGDVMKESMNCALTLAWNIIPDIIKKEINENKEGIGLHIHCPESSTPKDGPSAGLAITTAIISRIINVPIKNDVAMTGEVDLLGNAHAIGGLYSKLQGALNAGIKKVLIPRDNEQDLDIIFKKEEDENNNLKDSLLNSYLLENNESNNESTNIKIFRNKLEIYLVDNIYDVLTHSLVNNNLEFNKIL